MERPNSFKRFYHTFRDISKAVHASTSVDEVLEMVVWKATEAMDGKGAVVRILNVKTQRLELFAANGMDEKYLSKEPIARQQLISELCKGRKVLVIDDIMGDPRVLNKQELKDEGIQTIVDIPLTLRQDVIGIMRMYFDKPRRFSDDEKDLMIAIAEQCACAIDKARLIQEQQSQYNELAIQAEKLSSLGRMAAGIAHEINNPLGGILLFSSRMTKKLPVDSPIREGLDVIVREAQRCKNIIQDLLEFSRARQPQKVTASINEVIEKALCILKNEFQLHHITVEKKLSKDIPMFALDVSLMQQVFVNLLLNAMEAIQDNGMISVSSQIGADRDAVEVVVEDTGCGIPMDIIDKMFDPFFSTKPQGTGLGLAVSYGIVQNHKGSIRVSSNPGEGARFTVELPVSFEEDD
jgi:two-component system, NtrC family, sensor kinase